MKFWDRVAERYSKRPIADEAAYQKKLQVTREYLEPHMEVLELGCGTGSTAITHASCVKHIRAIDLSSKMLGIAKVHNMLKPGGVFVTSTACLGDMTMFIRPLISIGRILGLMPSIKVFTGTELKDSLTAAGFEIGYEWQPKKVAGLFIVANKVRNTR